MHESATAVLARLWSVVGLDRFAAASLENRLLVALIGLMVIGGVLFVAAVVRGHEGSYAAPCAAIGAAGFLVPMITFATAPISVFIAIKMIMASPSRRSV